jgi:hypothetical protein
MMDPRPDPWVALEAEVAAIGRLAADGDRYRRVRLGGAAALVDESLALARLARRAHRLRQSDPAAIAALVERLRSVAARYGALVEKARGAEDYLAAVAAWKAGDGPALRRLIPEVFADVALAEVESFLYHPVGIMGERNRPIDPAGLAARVHGLARDGLTPAEPGTGIATDEVLQAVVLVASWAALDTPLALRRDGRTLGAPLFRLGASDEILVYTPRLEGPFEVALAATAPDQERWPEVGVEYAEYRDALAGALAALGRRVTYMPP